MADRLREEGGFLDDQIQVALGHNQITTTGGYGAVRQGTVRVLADMIGRVTFEGVEIDRLIALRSAA